MNPVRLPPSDQVAIAKAALDAARRYQRDWLEHGTERVNRHYEGVEGGWLEQWGEDDPGGDHPPQG